MKQGASEAQYRRMIRAQESELSRVWAYWAVPLCILFAAVYWRWHSLAWLLAAFAALSGAIQHGKVVFTLRHLRSRLAAIEQRRSG
jgi:hypothetical protein